MAIKEHPATGTILIADFDQGFREPEMVKRRPVIVVSPKISVRPELCTVVPLSTSPPRFPASYHCQLIIEPELPAPWDGNPKWVKGDMLYSLGFHRLDFIRTGKDGSGKRLYRYEPLPPAEMRRIRECILCGLGLAILKKHLP